MELEDLPGVGKVTAEKLRRAGFETIESIAVASPAELAIAAGLNESSAAKIISVARKFCRHLTFGQTRSGRRRPYRPRREAPLRITTGCECLDRLLDGGVETQAITEFFGSRNSGKTQICFQLAVMAQREGSVIYIDANGSFRAERVGQIAQNAGLDPMEVLKNIKVAVAPNMYIQMLLVDEARGVAEELEREGRPVRLLIVDSLTTHFQRAVNEGIAYADAAQRLNRHLCDLVKFSETYNAAVVITNPVSTSGRVYFPNLVSHAVTHRVRLLRRGRSDKRVARLIDSPIDSPNLPEKVAFRITERGIEC